MKRTLLAWMLTLGAVTAFAHEGHHAKKVDANKLTGEVVDVTCYMDHGDHGAAHATCARKCIEKGMPVAILAEGKLYTVIISSHESPNAQLAPYAGKMVTITGKRSEKDGMRVIDMDKVEPAGAEPN